MKLAQGSLPIALTTNHFLLAKEISKQKISFHVFPRQGIDFQEKGSRPRFQAHKIAQKLKFKTSRSRHLSEKENNRAICESLDNAKRHPRDRLISEEPALSFFQATKALRKTCRTSILMKKP